jgi:hypothetical protein
LKNVLNNFEGHSRAFTAAGVAAAASVIARPAAARARRLAAETIIGEGEHRYRVKHHFPQLPDRFTWQTTHGVALDAAGKVPLYHPSVNPVTGEVCAGLWDKCWVETWWLSQFAKHLRSHLVTPMEGGLNAAAGVELKGDLALYEAKAREACSRLRVRAPSGGSA